MDLKVRVRTINTKILPTQSEILDAINEACAGGNLDVATMYQTPDGAIIKMRNIESVYILLDQETKEKLKSYNLKPINPAWLNPAKTIFIHQLPFAITSRENTAIFNEIKNSNQDIKLEFVGVLRNNRTNHKYLKITLSTPEMAKEISEKGLRLYNLIVTPDMIAQHWLKEEPEVRQCYKCFSNYHHLQCEIFSSRYVVPHLQTS